MTVSDQIIAVLDSLCEKFGIAIDWTQQNVLPYLSELAGRYIKYVILTDIVWIVTVLSITAMMWGLTKKAYKKVDWEYGLDTDDGWSWAFVASMIVAIILTIVTVIAVPCSIFEIVEALTIPEKTIIDYVIMLME